VRPQLSENVRQVIRYVVRMAVDESAQPQNSGVPEPERVVGEVDTAARLVILPLQFGLGLLLELYLQHGIVTGCKRRRRNSPVDLADSE
jgi:hypothetical protein